MITKRRGDLPLITMLFELDERGLQLVVPVRHRKVSENSGQGANRPWVVIQAIVSVMRLALDFWDRFNGNGPGPLTSR
ncbi:hypothetical protein [Microtetraspora malaysiensis]|uniref:Uncharacterized protein n=1 Tax=Microtetraspora malaysiensis TaxID=161358 RepID=A0ABW6T504_9ACTN